MAAHAKLSASGAHRWIPCPGSIDAADGVSGTGSSYADEGSVAHNLAEDALTTGKPAASFIGTVYPEYPTFEVTWDMAEAVQEYVDYVNQIAAENDGGMRMIERMVNFDRWVPGGFGTADAIIVGTKRVHIIDLKFGQGVRVDADDNPQAMLYGLGVLSELDAVLDGTEEFVLTIVQPRLNHISEWIINYEDLLAWGDMVVKPAALAALDPNSPRVPGDKQCRFCNARATCRALAEFVVNDACAGFESVEDNVIPLDDFADYLTPPAELSLAEIGQILNQASLFKAWIGAIEDHAKYQMEQGFDVPGWKMVAGRGSRDWSDVDAAERAIRRKLGANAAYKPRVLISPAQAEKLLGKNDYVIKTYVEKKEGAPTVAPVSDKRQAIIVDHSADFDNVA